MTHLLVLRRGSRVLLPIVAGFLIVGCGSAEARKDRYVERAQALMGEENYEKAELELRNALQIAPDDPRARLLAARLAERTGEIRRAVQAYQGVLDVDEFNLEALAGLSRIYALGGLPERALELASKGLARAPGDADLLTSRAAALARQGDLDGAMNDARAALASDPASENAIALLASLYARAGRDAEAVALVDRGTGLLPRSVDLRLVLAEMHAAAGRRAEAVRALEQVIALQPRQLDHRYRLAQYHVGGGDVAAAEAVLRGAISAAPDELEPKIALATLLSSRKSFEAGERELRAFVDADPDDLELRLALGDFYAGRGRDEQASAAFREVVEQDDRGARGLAARNRLAAAAMRANDVREADRLVAEVLAENPQDNDALIMRADLALARGDAPAAITDLRAVLRDQPESVPVRRALARAYLRSEETALAEETLRSAIESNPADPQLRVDLAEVQLRTGQAERALRTLEDTVAETPANLAAQERLFRLQVSNGDLRAASETAAAVRSARPDLPLGQFMTGVVLRAEGKRAAATTAFESALKLQPSAAEPLVAITEMQIEDRRVGDALARLENVAREQPSNVVARNLRGELLTAERRYAEALVVFDEAIRLSPGWWVPYRGKSLAQIAGGEGDAAAVTLERGLEATRDALPLGMDLAALHERNGRHDAAIATYERLLASSPSNAVVANNLAMLLATYRSDAQSLERARELSAPFADSQVPAFLNTVGWVQYRLGLYREAIPMLQKAADGDPGQPLMRFHLAMAQLKAGERVEAKRNLEVALASGTPFAGRDEARAALEKLGQG